MLHVAIKAKKKNRRLPNMTGLNYLSRIEILQKRCLKYFDRLPHLTPTNILFGQYATRVLPVENMYQYEVCKLVFSMENNICYHNMTFSRVTHRFSTRNRGRLATPAIHTEIGRRNLAYIGPFLFNSLPDFIRNVSRFNSFKKRLEDYLLSLQQLTPL